MDERTAKLTLKNISKTFYDRQGEHPTIADVSFESVSYTHLDVYKRQLQ